MVKKVKTVCFLNVINPLRFEYLNTDFEFVNSLVLILDTFSVSSDDSDDITN